MVGRTARAAVALALAASTMMTIAGAAGAGAGADSGPDAGAGTKSPAVLHVFPGPGTPLQNAVNRAHPGGTLIVHAGHYRESVLVTKALTIHGAGSGSGGSELTPPRATPEDSCNTRLGQSGFCVSGRTDVAGHVLRRVGPVTVTGFLIHGFPGSAVTAMGTDRLTVSRVRATRNGRFGIVVLAARHPRIGFNSADGNGLAGVQVGDSPGAGAWVGGNTLRNNQFGVFLRDSTEVVAKRNTATGNCVGVLALTTGEGATAGARMRITGNTADGNTKACPAGGKSPATSGIGIALTGVSRVIVTRNTTDGNHPTGPSIASGGIVVMTAVSKSRAPASEVLIAHDEALRNRPVDLFWDGRGPGVRFDGDVCRTSDPRGLCRRERSTPRQARPIRSAIADSP